MKAKYLNKFLSDHEGMPVTRIVYVYNILMAFRDMELPERDIYYLLNSKHYTAWRDYSFYHVSEKHTLKIPADTEQAVKKLIENHESKTPEDGIQDFLWKHFRVRPSGNIEEIKDFAKVIAYRSREFESNTACQLKYYNIDLSPKEMTKLIQNPQTMPFSQEELCDLANLDQFSNPVQWCFAHENESLRSQVRIHNVENSSSQPEELTVLFSDMKDFSEMVKTSYKVFTDEHALQEFRILCKYYQVVICRVIRKQSGEIVHTAGDAFVAVFRGDNAASRALTSARNMMTSVAQIRENVKFKELKESFVTRIGLDTGKAQYGYLGPYEMKELTVFGRCVNVGSRLEGEVKLHSPDGGIMLTEETAVMIEDFKQSEFKKLSVPVKELNKKLECYLLPFTEQHIS